MAWDIQPQGEEWRKFCECQDEKQQGVMLRAYVCSLQNRIKELKKQLDELQSKKKSKTESHDSAWEFHWNGHDDYREVERCFYGDFS